MRIVLDALGVRPGSAQVVTQHLLTGWRTAEPADELIVLVRPGSTLAVPAGVQKRVLPGHRLVAQSLGVRRAARDVGADAVLAAVPAGTFLGAGPSRRFGAIVYDLRHELRPEQFSRARRLVRRVSWGWTFRRADALLCISDRTRRDLVRLHPGTEAKAVAMLLGADHANGWSAGEPERDRYVLAFGHFANKNVNGVLAAWALSAPQHPGLRLHVTGLRGAAREAAVQEVRALGVGATVDLLGWLDDAEFEREFAGASAILFPSDFEGFGLPAVEAMILGIPVVVSSDPALLEVTGGLAAVAASDEPAELARALDAALEACEEDLGKAREHAAAFTWRRTAEVARAALR